MFPAALLEADIPDMGSELKGVIEFLYTAPRFMIQSEYFFDCLHRTSGQNSYRAHGGYIQGGILLKGREFEYDTMYAVPGRPVTPQAIELVARFNYTDMNIFSIVCIVHPDTTLIDPIAHIDKQVIC